MLNDTEQTTDISVKIIRETTKNLRHTLLDITKKQLFKKSHNRKEKIKMTSINWLMKKNKIIALYMFAALLLKGSTVQINNNVKVNHYHVISLSKEESKMLTPNKQELLIETIEIVEKVTTTRKTRKIVRK